VPDFKLHFPHPRLPVAPSPKYFWKHIGIVKVGLSKAYSTSSVKD